MYIPPPLLVVIVRWSDGCGAAEATGLGFVCFVVINPCVLSANSVDLDFFVSLIVPISPLHPLFQIIRFVISTFSQFSSSKFPSFYSPPPFFFLVGFGYEGDKWFGT